MKKLSKTQVKVLRALGEPGAVAHYMRYMGRLNPISYWSLPKGRIRLSTMRWLIQYKLVKPTYDNLGYLDSATITPAGREYLSKLEAPDEPQI